MQCCCASYTAQITARSTQLLCTACSNDSLTLGCTADACTPIHELVYKAVQYTEPYPHAAPACPLTLNGGGETPAVDAVGNGVPCGTSGPLYAVSQLRTHGLAVHSWLKRLPGLLQLHQQQRCCCRSWLLPALFCCGQPLVYKRSKWRGQGVSQRGMNMDW